MRRARARSDCGESGFTLVELMVAITLLLIGVLGVVTMVSAANDSSTITGGRQNATSLLRRAIETGRAVPYSKLTSAGLRAALVAEAPDLADSTPSDPAWTVRRSGYTYTLDATVCTVDDGADKYGAHGSNDPPWCADSTQTGTQDAQPNDYKRLRVTATWTVKGRAKRMTQAGLIPSTGQGDLPATTEVKPTNGGPTTITAPATTSITFDVKAVNNPATLSWLVNGQTMESCPPATATCSGSGAAWTFTWGLGSPVIDTNPGSVNYRKCIAGSYVYDGTYTVSARAYTATGLTGDADAPDITIDRCTPTAPPNLKVTGRDNAGTAPIDVQWNKNPEADVVGYRVFRGSSTNSATQICPANASDPPLKRTYCVDPNPPPYTNAPYYYGVYAYDADPSTGAERQGALSYANANTGNRAPSAPTAPSGTVNADGTVTIRWTLPPSPMDPDTGDSIAAFRIYRRDGSLATAPSYLDRLQDAYNTIGAYCPNSAPGTVCSWTDTTAGGTQHTYNITSVDTHLRESSYTPNLVK